MNPRTILILAVVTAVIAIAAMFSLRGRESLTAAATSEVAGQPLFPDLTQRVNEAAAVTVTSADGTFRLAREGEAWGAADKGGYPIDFERVKALVVGVSGFDVVEKKTANPELFSKLGVEDPEGDEASSKRVTIEDGAGTVLADVIVGEPRISRGRGRSLGDASLYARRSDEDQCYEVTGRLTVDTNLSNWLDKQIVRLERERVHRVEIRHPNGERLVVFKENEDDANFQVEDLPEGRELQWEGIASSIGGALSYLNLEDVGGEDLIDFDAHEKTVAEFTTWDGLIVSCALIEVDEKVYLRVDALFDEGARHEVATVPPPPPPTEEGEEAPEIVPPLETEAEDTGKTPEEVTEEATEIVERVKRWTYVVPGYTAANLRKRMDELLKEVEVPEEPVEAPVLEEEPAAEEG